MEAKRRQTGPEPVQEDPSRTNAKGARPFSLKARPVGVQKRRVWVTVKAPYGLVLACAVPDAYQSLFAFRRGERELNHNERVRWNTSTTWQTQRPANGSQMGHMMGHLGGQS
jgi:hypothetical protein